MARKTKNSRKRKRASPLRLISKQTSKSNPKKSISWLPLIGFVLLCNLIGILGSLFTFSSISEWYVYLQKPFFSPPNWVFGPVWTLLYIMMGVSAYLVWKARSSGSGQTLGANNRALSVFAIQLALNCLWSILFFGLKSPMFAFLDIVLLWISIVYVFKLFYPIEKKAAYLLIPYLLWVSFASLLNLAIWVMNG